MAAIIHSALIWLCLVLFMFWMTGPFVKVARSRLIVAVAAALFIGLIPLPLLGSLYAALAGAFWPLSAGLALGLAYELEKAIRGRSSFSSRDYLAFCGCILLCGLLIIPAALAHPLPDLYALGFHGTFVPGLMAAMLVAALLVKSWLIVIWLALASIWTLAGVNPGLNLWDSLVDPVVFVGALWNLALAGGRVLFARPG